MDRETAVASAKDQYEDLDDGAVVRKRVERSGQNQERAIQRGVGGHGFGIRCTICGCFGHTVDHCRRNDRRERVDCKYCIRGYCRDHPECDHVDENWDGIRCRYCFMGKYCREFEEEKAGRK